MLDIYVLSPFPLSFFFNHLRNTLCCKPKYQLCLYQRQTKGNLSMGLGTVKGHGSKKYMGTLSPSECAGGFELVSGTKLEVLSGPWRASDYQTAGLPSWSEEHVSFCVGIPGSSRVTTEGTDWGSPMGLPMRHQTGPKTYFSAPSMVTGESYGAT